MESQIKEILEHIFEEFPDFDGWRNLKTTIQKFGMNKINIKQVTFENRDYEEIKHILSFDNHKRSASFLVKEKKLAVDVQDFVLAANIHTMILQIQNGTYKENIFYLKYKLLEQSEGAYVLLFETNLLSFKYRLIEEFSLIN